MRSSSLVARGVLRRSGLSWIRAENRFGFWSLLILIAGSILFSSPHQADAETITMNGADGADGEMGLEGAPGGPGGNGEDGASATAIANAPLEANTAVATGGSGGNGGRGGSATPGSGTNGGMGGNGGNGGLAIADASTVGADFVRATASGGNGASRGLGGSGSAPGVDGEFGMASGIGGDATASASIDQEFAAGSSAGLDGEALAVGGNGIRGSSAGGNAVARITGTATGIGSPGALHRLEATARGGSEGAGTGDARAEANGRTSNGTLSVSATAQARKRSISADLGGDAVAIASGIHSGQGQLNVTATSRVGDGLNGVRAGRADVSASGIATDGADVRVEATVSGPHDSDLRNAVSGSTSGRLELVQNQTNVSGFRILPAIFGVAKTSLTAENTGGGDLAIRVTSMASRVWGNDEEDGTVIVGDVVGRSNAGSNVDVSVSATAPQVRQENLDDPSLASRILGISNGGDVSVEAAFRTFAAPTTTQGLQTLAGAGNPIVMDRAVGGSTTGNLRLVQDATAGDGRDISLGLSSPPGSTAFAGAGGEVINRIVESGSFRSLTFEGFSRGGRGGSGGGLGVDGADGGRASLSRDGTNDSGPIDIQGYAWGGDGGGNSALNGRGGDAVVDFRATTFGDGNSISIGQVPNRRIRQGARAGSGGSVGFGRRAVDGRGGGRADSQSAGLAHGDSEVSVFDFAQGGSAGSGRSGSGDPLFVGRGGEAVSRASAIGGGISRTAAYSDARGGSGGPISASGASGGGDAQASAFSAGLGEANATALAFGGWAGRTGFLEGSALATSEASGATGTVIAEAATGSGSDASFRALVRRDYSGGARVQSTATYAAGLPARSAEYDGTGFMTGRPLAADIGLAAARHSGLDSLLSGTPPASVEALGQWSARGRKGEARTQLVELDITLAQPDPSAELALAIFKLDASGGGFDSLAFRLEVLGATFGEEVVFGSLAEANAYFAAMITLGDAFVDQFVQGRTPGVRAIFEVSLNRGQEIAFGLAVVVVPEPSTAILLGIGLALIAVRRSPNTCRNA